MIIQKDGQIIVDKLRPMSEVYTERKAFIIVDANYKRVVAMINNDKHIHMLMYLDSDFGQAYIGWIPMPIYQPKPEE